MEINITWNICRVCLVEEPKKPQGEGAIETNMRHLFNEDKMLAKQIYECSGIMMKPNDSLPEKICKKCFANVKQAINFRKTCRTSDTFLQSVLQRTKSTSMLFKPDRPPLEDFDEDIMEEDKNEVVTTPNTDKEVELKRPATPLEHTAKKLCRDSHSSEITSNTDDLIDHEVEEMAESHDHIVEIEEILPPTEIEEKQTVTNIRKTTGTTNNSSQLQAFKIDEETGEEDLHDMKEEEENSPETNNEDFFYVKDIKNENDANLHDDDEDEETGEEEHHEEHIETDEHQEEDEESIQFIPLDEEEQEMDEDQTLILHSETDMEDNQAQVSSTVITKQEEEEEEAEAGFIPLQEPNSNLSSASHDLSTEYIVDEYLIDDSHSNLSSENSSIIVVNSKITKYASSTSRKGNVQLEHRNNKNSQQQQVFVCDLCGNNFGNRQLLNGHMKVHRQEKNHQCELCSKRFITACNLQAHMRIHTGEKPFECQYCGRRFSDRSSNLRHERIHTNEKPFHCNECGKCFSLATSLKKHEKVHTGERSYRCEPCAKSFKLPHQLKAHRNTMLHRAVEQLGILGN